MGETAPFWRFSATSYPDLEEGIPNRRILKSTEGSSNSNVNGASRVYTLPQMILYPFKLSRMKIITLSYIFACEMYCFGS